MAGIRKDQLEDASKFMSALWNEIVKPYYNPEKDDEYWLGLIDKINNLYDRFGLDRNKKMSYMMMGFANGLETEYKGRKSGNG